MSALKQHLLRARDIDGTQRIVRTAEREQLGIVRPTRSVDSVEGDRQRQLEGAILDVPNLHLTEATGVAAGGPTVAGRAAGEQDAARNGR